MDTLLIYYLQQVGARNGWYVEVANTNISFRFAGADYYEQTENMREFAETLEDGDPSISRFLENAPPDVNEELFSTTDSLVFDTEEVLELGGAALDTDLPAVGEFLLECLGLLRTK